MPKIFLRLGGYRCTHSRTHSTPGYAYADNKLNLSKITVLVKCNEIS